MTSAADLGLNLEEIPDGTIITGTVAIIRVMNSDGDSAVWIVSDDHTDWITRRGLLEVALDNNRTIAIAGDD